MYMACFRFNTFLKSKTNKQRFQYFIEPLF